MHDQEGMWTPCICSAYAERMVSRAKDTHTTNRVVRIDDNDWADYEKACAAKGLTRSADIRMHIKSEVAAWRRANRGAAAHTVLEERLQELLDELESMGERPENRVQVRAMRKALATLQGHADEF